MIISFEASANVDTTLFGYFSMQYDPEFFNDIKENLTEISKEDTLSFKLDPEEVKLLQGSYENVKRIISISDVEQNKFTNVFSFSNFPNTWLIHHYYLTLLNTIYYYCNYSVLLSIFFILTKIT